jgi:hypothetical protein
MYLANCEVNYVKSLTGGLSKFVITGELSWRFAILFIGKIDVNYIYIDSQSLLRTQVSS